MERWKRAGGAFTLYIPTHLTRKITVQVGTSDAPPRYAAVPTSFIQMLQLTQEARLLILFNNSDSRMQKKTNALPPLGASPSDSQQPGLGTLGTQRSLVPREVTNENRARSAKYIIIPKKMQWAFLFNYCIYLQKTD